MLNRFKTGYRLETNGWMGRDFRFGNSALPSPTGSCITLQLCFTKALLLDGIVTNWGSSLIHIQQIALDKWLNKPQFLALAWKFNISVACQAYQACLPSMPKLAKKPAKRATDRYSVWA